MPDTNSKKMQARYDQNLNNHVRFWLCFTASDFVLVGRPPLMVSSADRMAYELYFKLLPSHSRLFLLIKVETEYAGLDQDSSQDTV